jgi:hypothetical protein
MIPAQCFLYQFPRSWRKKLAPSIATRDMWEEAEVGLPIGAGFG